MEELAEGVRPVTRHRLRQARWVDESAEVVAEVAVTLLVNGAPYATVALTPIDLEAWVIGFLAGEGVLRHRTDLTICQWHAETQQIWVRVPGFHRPLTDPERYLGSCCGQSRAGFLGLKDPPPVTGTIHIPAGVLQQAFSEVNAWARTQHSGGLHVAALVESSGQVVVASADVGRHNALDKVFGHAWDRREVALGQRAVLFSGRVSAEIVTKAARMGCPLIASNAAPTSLGISLAKTWGITVVGFLRSDDLSVYTHPERVLEA